MDCFPVGAVKVGGVGVLSIFRVGWLVCCLMTPGLSKDIRCHV